MSLLIWGQSFIRYAPQLLVYLWVYFPFSLPTKQTDLHPHLLRNSYSFATVAPIHGNANTSHSLSPPIIQPLHPQNHFFHYLLFLRYPNTLTHDPRYPHHQRITPIKTQAYHPTPTSSTDTSPPSSSSPAPTPSHPPLLHLSLSHPTKTRNVPENPFLPPSVVLLELIFGPPNWNPPN